MQVVKRYLKVFNNHYFSLYSRHVIFKSVLAVYTVSKENIYYKTKKIYYLYFSNMFLMLFS